MKLPCFFLCPLGREGTKLLLSSFSHGSLVWQVRDVVRILFLFSRKSSRVSIKVLTVKATEHLRFLSFEFFTSLIPHQGYEVQ